MKSIRSAITKAIKKSEKPTPAPVAESVPVLMPTVSYVNIAGQPVDEQDAASIRYTCWCGRHWTDWAVSKLHLRPNLAEEVRAEFLTRHTR